MAVATAVVMSVCAGLAGASADGTTAAATPSSSQVRGRAAAVCDATISFVTTQPDDGWAANTIMSGQVVLPGRPQYRLPTNPDWSATGDGTANWAFQYNALTWLDVLRREGARRGDRAMLRRYAVLLEDWSRTDTKAVPYAWLGMSQGMRAIAFACAVKQLGAPGWLVSEMREHGRYLAQAKNYVRVGNYAMHQNDGLMVLGYVLDDMAWQRMALQRNAAYFAGALDAEGVTTEGSVGYGRNNLKWMQDAVAYVTLSGQRLPASMRRVDRMATFLAHASTPDGRYEMLGDTLYGSDTRYAGDILKGSIGEYAQSGGHRGPRPDKTLAVFKVGYLFNRSGWGTVRPMAAETSYSLRFGRARSESVHAHQDAGSLTMYAHGSQLLWDQGLYEYYGGPMRTYVQSAAAHNRVTVAGVVPSLTASSPLVTVSDTARSTLATVQIRDLPGVSWTRTVLYSKRGRYLVVRDDLASSKPRTYTQRWHLAADRTVRRSRAGSVEAVHTGGLGADVDVYYSGRTPVLSVVKGRTRGGLMGWRSLDIGQRTAVPVIEAVRTGKAVTYLTVIIPRRAGATSASSGIRAARVSAGTSSVEVRSGPVRESVRLTRTSASVR